MLFGSYWIAPGGVSNFEVQTSEKMQDYFLDFVTDPILWLANGWPGYMVDQEGGGTLAQFGADGKAMQVVEGACHIRSIVYNTTP